MQIPFIGGAYESISLNTNAQKSINCFPVIDDKEAKDILAMYGTPGLKLFTTIVPYGNGSDGVVVISTNTTLTRDMQYSTLTVNSGITLNTAGYTITCSVLLTNNGTITDSDSGGDGGVGGKDGASGTAGQSSIVDGAGSGGDGGDSSAVGTKGSTGGKGGGYVSIHAKTLTNNGVIHTDGFAALNDKVGVASGANGGNGGTVTITYDAITAGTIRAAAGAHS